MKIETISTGAVLLLFLLSCLLPLTSSYGQPNVIPVSDSNVLQRYLCGTNDQQIPNNTVLQLVPRSAYSLNVSGLCLISDRHNIGIVGGNLADSALITCGDSYGLGFVNVNTLTIKNVVIEGCGAEIVPQLADSINATTGPCLSNTSKAVLAIVDSSEVSLSNVSIIMYYGYAILALNVYGKSVLSNLTIVDIMFGSIGTGSGIMVYYSKNSNASLNISNAMISSNMVSNSYSDYCLLEMLSPLSHRALMATPYAVALSVVYNQLSENVLVTLSNCSITQNAGGPVVMILYFDSQPNVTTVISDTQISANNAAICKCHGTSLAMVTYFSTNFAMKYKEFATSNHWTSLRVSNTTINDNVGTFDGKGSQSIIYLSSSQINSLMVHVYFENTNFVNNNEAGVLYADTMSSFDNNIKSLAVHFIDAVVDGNIHYQVSENYLNMPARAIMTFVDVSAVYISDSYFTHNVGSVIEALYSDVYMSGNVVFNYNSGSSGAALVLFHESYLFLYPNLSAHFEYNTYKYGGAIYSFNDKVADHTCAFQVLSSNFSEVNETGPRLLFRSNKASVGSTTVSSMSIFNCEQKLLDIKPTNMSQLYDIIFQFETHYDMAISADPVRIVPCVEKQPLQNYTNNNNSFIFSTFPGKQLNISLAALDGNGESVATQVQVQMYQGQKYRNLQPSSWWLSGFESEQILVVEASACNNFSLTIHYNSSSQDINSNSTAFFSFSDNVLSTFQAKIILQQCPPGFQLDSINGVCECSSLIKTMNREFRLELTCDIQNSIVNVPNLETWIGCYNNSDKHCEVVGISPSCFPGLCNYSAADSHQWISGSASICIDLREGALCSSCVHGYSVVFGSNQCQKCSNWWLFTIAIYAVAGLLLVAFLFVFRLTVSTGMLNGLIFFGNMWNSGPIEIFSHPDQNVWTTISSKFISLLNLGLVYPLCFYDGMTEIAKSWLQLVFPVYLLVLVALVVIVSRYSMRVSRLVYSRAVPVLVTVVHLSFSGLFLAVIDIFSVGRIYTSNNTFDIVWLRDGTVPYFSLQHVALMTVSSFLGGVFILPYLILLIGARWWIKFKTVNLYFKPIIDAAHGPYKDNMHYWFSLRLILLLQQMVVYAALRGVQGWILYSVNGPILFAFTIFHTSARPFKSKAVNIIDDLMMLAICLVVYACSALYYQYSVTVTIPSSLVTAVFLVFIVLLGYHILFTILTYHRSKSLSAEKAFQYLASFIDYDASKLKTYQSINDDRRRPTPEFREPLLDMSYGSI